MQQVRTRVSTIAGNGGCSISLYLIGLVLIYGLLSKNLLRSVFVSLSLQTKLIITLYACLPVVPLHAAPPLQQLSKGKVLPEKAKYVVRRTLDAWKYGSGSDFKL